jgi:hypothetical protein
MRVQQSNHIESFIQPLTSAANTSDASWLGFTGLEMTRDTPSLVKAAEVSCAGTLSSMADRIGCARPVHHPPLVD